MQNIRKGDEVIVLSARDLSRPGTVLARFHHSHLLF